MFDEAVFTFISQSCCLQCHLKTVCSYFIKHILLWLARLCNIVNWLFSRLFSKSFFFFFYRYSISYNSSLGHWKVLLWKWTVSIKIFELSLMFLWLDGIDYLFSSVNRCWFGKEPGKYMDYIYQGPVILVLLVGDNTQSHNTAHPWPHLRFNTIMHACTCKVILKNLLWSKNGFIMKAISIVYLAHGKMELIFLMGKGIFTHKNPENKK